MSFTGTTLEQFIENQCGMITPNILHLLEPHREFVEQALLNFQESGDCWEQYSEKLWAFLPVVQKDHFKS